MAMDHVDYGMDYESMEVMMENPHEIAEKQILDRDFFNGSAVLLRPPGSVRRKSACLSTVPDTVHILPPFWGHRYPLGVCVQRSATFSVTI